MEAVTSDPRREKLDRFLARPMFFLSLAFLAITAGITHRLGHGHITFFETELILWGLWLLWPLFILEGLLRVCTRPEEGLARRLGHFLLTCLLPPVRLAARSYADRQRLWLLWLGWQTVDKALQRRLERAFSAPMVVIALLVLPILGLEYNWAEEVRADFGLALSLDIGSSIIWMAFAIEFIVMIAVAEKKLSYCLRNWMDLAIVLLPLVDFLPFLRLLRLGRIMQLQQLGNMSRVYRLRGLVARAWRALLILEVVQWLTGHGPAKRLKRLRELLAAKEEELTELRKEIDVLEKQVAEAGKVEAPVVGQVAPQPVPVKVEAE